MDIPRSSSLRIWRSTTRRKSRRPHQDPRDGELTKKLTIEAHAFSASASEKIAKAGGKAVVIDNTVPAKTAAAS